MRRRYLGPIAYLFLTTVCLAGTGHDNQRLAALFAADQADRLHKGVGWQQLEQADARRMAELDHMLILGQVSTGQDFYEAAFIEQHGHTPDDFLRAHVHAMASLAMGYGRARWIAAATLDRYLQAIGRKQVFGTQAMLPAGSVSSLTRNPYDPTLLSDPVRQALGVADRKSLDARLRVGNVVSTMGDE